MKAKLSELCSGYTKNIAMKEVDNKSGIYPIFGASGFIKNIDSYVSEVPYVAVVKDGAGVGRAFLCPAKSSLLGTMQYIVPRENVDIRYLLYIIEGLNLGATFRGSTIPHIYFKDYKGESVNIVSYDEQIRIADKFELITNAIERCKKAILLFDELVKSRFVVACEEVA